MKPKISSKNLCVCKKVGLPHGYGETPVAAFRDQLKRAKKVFDYKTEISVLKSNISVFKNDFYVKSADFNELENKYKELLKESTSIRTDDIDSWVLMASTMFKLSPREAVAKMKTLGVSVREGEFASADRMEKLLSKWKTRLGVK